MKFPHNISRIEAFSDAVFAFAATLLVVSLGTDVSDSIIEVDFKSFTGFFVSFFVLVMLWYLHYNFFRRTKYMDNLIIGINAVLLFVVLYYVFPLKTLVNSWFGSVGMTPTKLASIFELYGLGFALIFLCLSLMYLRAYKKTKHIDHAIDLLFYVRHFFLFVLIAVVSIIIAYLQVGLNYGLPGILYSLLGPVCALHSYFFYKKFKPD